MQEKFLFGYSPLGFHRIAYTEWGEQKQRPPLICVHGLTRNGRDFDHVGQMLAKETQVICPDMVGRGKSDWLKDPTYYNYPQYLSDTAALIARVGTKGVDWIGTSMGGIIGMIMAAAPNTPIRRLVINDVGPFIPVAGLKRIAEYVGVAPEFSDVKEVEKYMRKIYSTFGPVTGDDWEHFAAHGHRKSKGGKLTLAHDPGIAKNFETIDKDVDLWAYYDQIRCPTLLLHGMQSDVLTPDVVEQMTKRGPQPRVVELPKVGHAPALMDATRIAIIAEFLRT